MRVQRLQRWQFFLMQASNSSGNGGEFSWNATQALVAAKRTGELLALLSNPKTDVGQGELVRPLAAEALARICPRTDLADLASDSAADPTGRISAARALALGGNSEELKSALLAIVRDRSLGDTFFSVRWRVVELLRALEDTKTLVAILRDASLDTCMRVRCADACLELGVVDEITVVAQSVETEAWTRVRLAERLGTAERQDDACKIFLDIALDRTLDSEVRAAAVSGLSGLGRVAELVQFSCNAALDVDIRKEALWSLGDPAPAAAGALCEQSLGFIEALPPELRNCAVDAWTLASLRERYSPEPVS